MSLGTRLAELRRSKHLSQESVAEQLNVTRQTVSKWETDQSLPDFDKIEPLCKMYAISADELINGKNEKKEGENRKVPKEENTIKKKAIGIGISIFFYFLSVIWIMIAIPVLLMNPIVASSIFLLICAIATFIIVYTCMVYKTKKVSQEQKEKKLADEINSVISIFFVIIYLTTSFFTQAWHITWIIWIIYALIAEIIKLIFMLGREKNEE